MRLAGSLLVLVGRGVVGGVRRLALLVEFLVDRGGHHQALLLIAKILELGVFEGLACAQPIVGVVRQQLGYQFATFFAYVRYQLVDTCAFFVSEVEIHVRRVFLEAQQNFLRWRAQNIMDFVYLV